ncbi:MAG: hypothetical protein KOO62_07075 [candidate division Zixibacteria bacterium]|nr:hypothetical protein [candidate division Zixibacteria bacterium]
MLAIILTILLSAVLLMDSVGVAAAERPSLFGFSPAYLEDTLTAFTPPSNPPYRTREERTRVIIQVDESGRVTGVEADDSQQSPTATYVRDYLKTMAFEPALFENQPIASQLPVYVTMQPSRKYPDFMFPFSEDGGVVDRELYLGTFELNDIRLPTLKMFPKYFCSLPDDSTNLYRFMMLKIALDEHGEVLDVQEVFSTYAPCTQMISSAALWAEYAPAVVKGKPVSSECFVAVSLFPSIAFSLGKWRPDDSDTLSPTQRWRVELIADTVGLMRKPVPRRAGELVINVSARAFPTRDTVSAVLMFDTSGNASVRRTNKVSKPIRKAIGELRGRLDFHPALDYAGRPQRFSGLVHLVLDVSGRIRIDCLW